MKQYPLSPRQLEDWKYNYNLKPGVPPTIMRIETDLAGIDIGTLKSAFSSLIQKHESLRTTFRVIENQVIQQVEELSGKFELMYVDEYTPSSLHTLSEMVIREMKDLENGPLIRGIACKKEAGLYRLHIIVHHIISDQWSVNIIKNDLQQLYLKHANNQVTHNEIPSEQLGAYILSKTAFYNEHHDNVIRYWESKLETKSWHSDYDIIHRNLLSPPPAERAFPWKGLTGTDLIANPTGEAYTAAISEHLYEQLQQLRYNEKSSMLNILLTAINLLGAKLTNNRQILIQCHHACRQEAITANIIGNLLGKLLIFTDIHPDESISALMNQTGRRYQEATSHIIFSSEKLNPLELTTGNFLFFNFLPKEMQNNSLYNYKEPAFSSNVWAESPLVCQAFEYKNTVVLKWSYHLQFFNRTLIELLAAQFEEILEMMTGDSQTDIKSFLNNLD
ncbi:Condensation domain-containing protein [Chitinophaga ginsengisegetis]|uniref:Condensation domain-containing protein n=1 Tax=Chitinophaga ginsengisegetis TaxID=393003 RepID=A0A1T5PD56_9BACT|nr:condensation domain-containing protein [Chitinophaga ginsengisegetis]SKD10519.1 Condensation domain-containing protein [Chitinophaga ginsengisegetis]